MLEPLRRRVYCIGNGPTGWHSMDFAQARKAMVDNQLRTSNVTDRRILRAMGEVPRESFIPARRQALAYIDEAHDLGGGRSLAAPAQFAKLIQLADVLATDVVLDLGAGTGYSTVVLAQLAHDVIGVESDGAMVAHGNTEVSKLALTNARLVQAALSAAPKAAGGYDLIVLEGAVERVPQGLFALLKDGGRLVATLQSGATAVANLFVKSGAGINSRAAFNASLPPLGVGTQPVDEFVF